MSMGEVAMREGRPMRRAAGAGVAMGDLVELCREEKSRRRRR